jgi:DNA replication protein DnaC
MGENPAPESVEQPGIARRPVIVARSEISAPETGQEQEVCPKCKGAGWLRMEVPVGHPMFGKTYPCECRTQAAEQRNLEDLYRLSNLDAFQTKVFLTFDPEVQGVAEAYDAATDFATNPEGWLVLLGGYGCGKTHLAAAIANYVVQGHGSEVYFAVAPDLLHNLRAAYAPGSEVSYDERFEQIRSVYLLIIDDLGAEQTTPWAAEKLYQIFNYRYNLRLPTVITSNCDLDSIDPRIASRLCDPDLCRHVFMTAADFRMRRTDPRFVHREPGQGGGSQHPMRNPGTPRRQFNRGNGTR